MTLRQFGAIVIGVIVFSYGLTTVEPNVCNRRLAQDAMRILDQERSSVLVVAQWEASLAMSHVDLVVGPVLSKYLGSADIIEQAGPMLRENQVTEIIPVCQTFLQYRAVCAHLRGAGYTVVRRKLSRTGHCPGSLQPWTRNALRLIGYGILQKLRPRYHGKLIVTEQMRAIAARQY